jgi:hypothetical protein
MALTARGSSLDAAPALAGTDLGLEQARGDLEGSVAGHVVRHDRQPVRLLQHCHHLAALRVQQAAGQQ